VFLAWPEESILVALWASLSVILVGQPVLGDFQLNWWFASYRLLILDTVEGKTFSFLATALLDIFCSFRATMVAFFVADVSDMMRVRICMR
jgi:hypothetical protein